jgi:hypothetical protein
MCRIDDADLPSVYRSEMRTARKARRCEECAREIGAGERYQYIFMVIDGDAMQCHICRHCVDTACAWMVTNCGGFLIGEVARELREHAEEYPDLAPGLLELRGFMAAQWHTPDGTLMDVPPVPPGIKTTLEATATA